MPGIYLLAMKWGQQKYLEPEIKQDDVGQVPFEPGLKEGPRELSS